VGDDQAVLEDVYKYRGLRESSDKRQILFSGCSAGGVGVVGNPPAPGTCRVIPTTDSRHHTTHTTQHDTTRHDTCVCRTKVNANFVQATLRDLLKNNATRVLSLADAGIMFDYPLYPVQHPHISHSHARTHTHTLHSFSGG
jgi:hypothetical protein